MIFSTYYNICICFYVDKYYTTIQQFCELALFQYKFWFDGLQLSYKRSSDSNSIFNYFWFFLNNWKSFIERMEDIVKGFRHFFSWLNQGLEIFKGCWFSQTVIHFVRILYLSVITEACSGSELIWFWDIFRTCICSLSEFWCFCNDVMKQKYLKTVFCYRLFIIQNYGGMHCNYFKANGKNKISRNTIDKLINTLLIIMQPLYTVF